MVDLTSEQGSWLDLVISEYQDLESLDSENKNLGHVYYIRPNRVAFSRSFWREFGPKNKVSLTEALKNYYIILSNAVNTIKSEGRLFNPRKGLIEEIVLEGKIFVLPQKP